jgi:hypothetical protein
MAREPVSLPDKISGWREGVINGLIDYVASLRPLPGAGVAHDWTPDGLRTRMAAPIAPGFPWGKVAWGYVYPWESATQFRVLAGEVQIGTQTPVSCADTTVAITTEYAYVGWQYRISTKALTVQNFGASVTHEIDYVRKWLYYVRKNASPAGLEFVQYGHWNPVFPAVFGDG